MLDQINSIFEETPGYPDSIYWPGITQSNKNSNQTFVKRINVYLSIYALSIYISMNLVFLYLSISQVYI